MSPREIADLFFNGSLRVDQIIWLAANFDRPCEALDDFLENEDPEIVAELLGLPAVKVREHFAGNFANEELMALVAQRSPRTGFLLQAATPVPLKFNDTGKGYTHGGFGQYTTKWFYFDAFVPDDIARVLVAWQAAYVANRASKLKKPAKKKK